MLPDMKIAMSKPKIHQTSSFSMVSFSAAPFNSKNRLCEVKRRRLKVESIDSDHVEVELLVSGLCTMAAVIPVALAA